MKEPIISVSGLRGILGESLTPEVAIRYACAFAEGLPDGPILLGRDGRGSGRMLTDALQAGLAAIGRTTINAGVAATPTVGVLVREHQAAGGLQISASHNPPEYNGLKAFSAEGRVIDARQGQHVVTRYRSGEITWASYDRLGSSTGCEETVEHHWQLLRETINVERIRARQFRVLLDANHGAGSILGAYLLRQLNCEVTLLGGEPDGNFAHPPEPTTENLIDVLARVREVGAEIGFCQDPDADRLAVIDHQGRYLGEEYTLAMCVDHVLRSHQGPIVTNCSTSRMSEDLAKKHGVPFYRSAVGEANVVDVMLDQGAVLGGEGNGGVIDPRVGLVRDSFVGMALLLDAMAARQATIAELAAEIPRYEIYKTKATLAPERLEAAYAALKNHFAEATVDTMDGLRLDWSGRWLLVRPSNTEPIVRAIAEAETAAEAQRLCDEATAVLASL